MHVRHPLLERRLGEPPRHLLGFEILNVLVDPPQVPLRVTHARDPLAEGKLGDASHLSRALGDGALRGRLDIVDVDTQCRRRDLGLNLGDLDQQTQNREIEPFRGLEVIDARAFPRRTATRAIAMAERPGRTEARPRGTESTGPDDDHSSGQVRGYS